MSRRTGILGGTFDPIHYGHLAVAEEARTCLRLDRVLLLPAARHPGKEAALTATPVQRFEMVQVACSGNSTFVASAIEIERPGLSYTVTSLESLHRSCTDAFYLIIGADALVNFPRWHAIQRILELAQIVVVKRAGHPIDLITPVQSLPQLADRLTLIDGPQLEISSSELRRRVAEGRSIRYRTPDPVIAYINQHRLYHREHSQ